MKKKRQTRFAVILALGLLLQGCAGKTEKAKDAEIGRAHV